MASSFQNTLEESFDELFDLHFDQAVENFTIHGDQEERRKKRKKRAYRKKS